VIVQTLLVRDEADVVAASIEHHLAAGIDHVIATDNGSVDGTVDVLRNYEETGRVTLLHEPNQDYEQGRWVSRMARMAATEYRASWVINSDADEFWCPVDGSWDLRAALSTIPAQFGIVAARRRNLLELKGTTAPRPWPDRLVYLDSHPVTPRGTPLPPKVCHRGCADVVVAQGNHAVAGMALGSTWTEPLLEVLHVPMRGYAQYARKISNGGSSYEKNHRLDPGIGWHWREDYERLKRGVLRDTYESRLPSLSDIQADPNRFQLYTGLRRRLHELESQAIDRESLQRVTREVVVR
jgi:hypothetical protein